MAPSKNFSSIMCMEMTMVLIIIFTKVILFKSPNRVLIDKNKGVFVYNLTKVDFNNVPLH